TRYFIGSLPSLLLFVAVSLVWLSDKTLARFSRAFRNGALVAVGAMLLLGHIPFYAQLFEMNGKEAPWRALAEWISRSTPPGSAYVLDSAYVRREVPGWYTTLGRHGSAVPAFGSLEKYRNKNIR